MNHRSSLPHALPTVACHGQYVPVRAQRTPLASYQQNVAPHYTHPQLDFSQSYDGTERLRNERVEEFVEYYPDARLNTSLPSEYSYVQNIPIQTSYNPKSEPICWNCGVERLPEEEKKAIFEMIQLRLGPVHLNPQQCSCAQAAPRYSPPQPVPQVVHEPRGQPVSTGENRPPTQQQAYTVYQVSGPVITTRPIVIPNSVGFPSTSYSARQEERREAEDCFKKSGNRQQLTPFQREKLHEMYAKSKYLEPSNVDRVATWLGMKRHRVQDWFQNKRYNEKVKMLGKTTKRKANRFTSIQ
ncbi:hypothetical protein QR680_014070 [Steinernema hermaphroditum]|uniref:Homeobox domain-containing protein n=1 Tax=Steinernema hermaphroditum TaxID=289476 RepID=A0AA39M3K2_9BILA|nr:hypothetical protein QR680_014070 [Steinernema hermaphroditum]